MRIVILSLLFVASVAHAKKPKPAPAPAEITLPCGYAAGTTVRYRVEQTTTDTRPDVPEDVVVVRTDYTIAVESFDGALVTALVTTGVPELVDPPADPMVATLTKQAMSVPFTTPARVAYTHQVGQVQVLNTDDLAKDYAASAAAVRPTLEAQLSGLPPEARDGILAWFDTAMSNPALVAKPYVEVGQPVFAYSCITLAPGSYDYAAQLPNVLGPQPLPGKGTLLVGGVQDDRVHFVDAVALDPVSAMTILGPILSGMGLDVPAEAGLEDLAIDVSTRLDLDVSASDGWPIGWTHEQRIAVQGVRKIARTVVTRIE